MSGSCNAFKYCLRTGQFPQGAELTLSRRELERLSAFPKKTVEQSEGFHPLDSSLRRTLFGIGINCIISVGSAVCLKVAGEAFLRSRGDPQDTALALGIAAVFGSIGLCVTLPNLRDCVSSFLDRPHVKKFKTAVEQAEHLRTNQYMDYLNEAVIANSAKS